MHRWAGGGTEGKHLFGLDFLCRRIQSVRLAHFIKKKVHNVMLTGLLWLFLFLDKKKQKSFCHRCLMPLHQAAQKQCPAPCCPHAHLFGRPKPPYDECPVFLIFFEHGILLTIA